MTRWLLHLGTLSPYGMAQFARPVPTRPAPTGQAPADQLTSWRDDHAFAAVVEPLAHDLGWRLRVRRLAIAAATRPVARGLLVVALLGALAAVSLSLLVVTIADAWTTPLRFPLPAG